MFTLQLCNWSMLIANQQWTWKCFDSNILNCQFAITKEMLTVSFLPNALYTDLLHTITWSFPRCCCFIHSRAIHPLFTVTHLWYVTNRLSMVECLHMRPVTIIWEESWYYTIGGNLKFRKGRIFCKSFVMKYFKKYFP